MPQNWNKELANRCNCQRRAINKTRAAKNCIFTFLPQRIKVFHLLVPSPTATTQQSWVTSVPGKNLETLLHLTIALDLIQKWTSVNCVCPSVKGWWANYWDDNLDMDGSPLTCSYWWHRGKIWPQLSGFQLLLAAVVGLHTDLWGDCLVLGGLSR